MKKGGNIFNLNTNIHDKTLPKNNLTMGYEDNVRQLQNAQNLLSTKEYFQNKKMQLYKTEICRSHSEIGYCKYGNKCQFAHDISELRTVNRHPRYKTETCRTFWEEGSCPYGKRCCFIHIKNKFMENVKPVSLQDKQFILGSPQSVDGKLDLEIYQDNLENVNISYKNSSQETKLINAEVLTLELQMPINESSEISFNDIVNTEVINFKKIDYNDEFDFDGGMFNSIEQSVQNTHTQTISKISAVKEDNQLIRDDNQLIKEDNQLIRDDNQLIKEDNQLIKEIQSIDFDQYSDFDFISIDKIHFEVPIDCICKDYEMSPEIIQREWSDKNIKLSSEDSVFINSLFVTERRPFWETSDTSLWTKNSLFYVNMNNHKWK